MLFIYRQIQSTSTKNIVPFLPVDLQPKSSPDYLSSAIKTHSIVDAFLSSS